MKVVKHGNKYRVQFMINRKRHSVSFDHKPTQLEISRAVSSATVKANINNCTFRDACITYIETKSNVLSPSTVRAYYSFVRIIPGEFMEKRLLTITSIQVQGVVNDYADGHAPKTVANYAHFITAVLSYNNVDIRPPQLPQKEKAERYIPSVDDIRAILEQIRGTKYEVPLMLSVMGLRRSEVCALSVDDLDGNVLSVNKAKVQGKDNEWHIKSTKTTESTREVVIPEELAERIREQGYVFNGHPEMLYRTLRGAQERANIPPFPLHTLRHFFASYLHDSGYSDKLIQALGGWATPSVLNSVYQHAMNQERAKAEIAEKIGNILV